MSHTTDYEHVLDLPNVRAVEYDEDSDSVIVFVERKVSEDDLAAEDLVANAISEKATDVVEVGDISIQPEHPPQPESGIREEGTSARRSHRPPLAGASEIQAGATAATAGLLATVAEPESPQAVWSDEVSEGDIVRISNAHVYGDAETEFTAAVLQPSPYDGGGPGDEVGDFVGYVPISDDFVDAAARSCDRDESGGVLELHEEPPQEVIRSDYADLKGEAVTKSGRTTGVTDGEIVATSASVRVRYGKATITKRNQLLAGAMSAGGDSGSPVFLGTSDDPGALVGHLFAGSDSVTVINKAVDIETRLGVAFHTADEQDHVSEYTFEDYVEEELVAKYGDENVHRQYRFSNGRYADFLVEDPENDRLEAWELENDSGSLVNGSGQAIFYAQSAAEEFDADEYGGVVPVLCFPEGHIDAEERPLFRRYVTLREFEAPDDATLKGV